MRGKRVVGEGNAMRSWSMKWLAMGVLVTVAGAMVVSPALGGPSLKSLVKKAVKKEVTKQLGGKTGPAGAPGLAGAPGSAAAYAEIQGGGGVDEEGSFNVTDANVSDPAVGVYCIGGLPFVPRSAVATVQASSDDDTRDRITAVLVSSPSTNPFGCAAGDRIRVQIIDLGLIGATAEGFADNYVHVWIED